MCVYVQIGSASGWLSRSLLHLIDDEMHTRSFCCMADGCPVGV